jgi:hypothetical protein
MRKGIKIQAAAVAGMVLLAALMSISGCSKSTGPDFVMPVSLAAPMDDTQLASNVSRVILTVRLGNNIVLMQDVSFSNGAVEDVVEVPPGQNLVFVLDAYDAPGRLLYSGSAEASVGLGSDIVVNIQMIPQVLMLKIDPLYQTANPLADSSYYFDVYVYNVENLFGASFRIEYSSSVISPTYVEFGNFLGPQPLTMARIDSNYVAIGITRLQGQAGVSGSGHLARIHFGPIADGTTDLSFNLETVSLADVDGSPVNGFSTIILEWGRVLVSTPIP